ncbi:MAG: hypothetical protein MI923_22290 [Phycisphaerales bacterium]|nr:hypothetical protein [Phycisphaerales bacterium]
MFGLKIGFRASGISLEFGVERGRLSTPADFADEPLKQKQHEQHDRDAEQKGPIALKPSADVHADIVTALRPDAPLKVISGVDRRLRRWRTAILIPVPLKSRRGGRVALGRTEAPIV